MSANVPTDICFSFSGLMQRGGKTGPHKDGWGIAFYEGRGCRVFHDPYPSYDSEIARFVKTYPIKSNNIICHIRKANSGKVCLENTHPFVKQLWGRNWCFAHNGQLRSIKKQLKFNNFEPIGTTDSEFAFCWILDQMDKKFKRYPKDNQKLINFIKELCDELSQFGVFNILMSDSNYLFAHCSTKLVWITRKSPFGKAKLVDDELSIDFLDHAAPNDIATVLATAPLTANEEWHRAKRGEFLVFHEGLLVL